MTFKQLLTELHSTTPQPNPHYWRIILNNAKLVILETHQRNQGVVAKDLGMNITKLSSILPMLREICYAD